MSDEQATTTEAPPTFEVRLSGDKLHLVVTVPDPHENLARTAGRIARELPPLELAEDIDVSEARLAELLEGACQPGEDLVDHQLLSGTPCQPPRDGEIQWQEDFFAAGFALDEESDRMDYWERAEKRAVTENQLLAVVLMPLDGTPGLTLQGNDIPVPKPRPARLRAGKGVRTEEQDDRIDLYASVAGRINHKDGTVSVDDVYTVRGDVSLETGNIHHTGALMVQGDVKEGACIECDGDVIIKGLVEPCDIVCGANLTVAGGIVGDDEHGIEVAGDAQARYLNDVNLRCDGDVVITSQIDHSHVVTMGCVIIPKGRIAGGEIRAYRGIQVGHAGAAGATGTMLAPGADWRLEERQHDRKAKVAQLQEIRGKLDKTIKTIIGSGAYGDAEREKVEGLREKIARIDKAQAAETEVQNRENDESAREAVREVAVLLTLWTGVTFRIGNAVLVSDRNYDLPRLVTLRRDKVRILPMGELNTPGS